MEAQNIKTVMVIGAGIMGQGIIQSFAQAGLSVRVVDVGKEVLDRCMVQVDANLRLFQEFGLLEEEPSSIKARIHPVLTDDLAREAERCDFVLETVPENLDLKKKIFAQLDSCHPEVIISSNTSSCTVASLTEGCRTPNRMIGLHYFNPAHIMPLVEIHYSPWTSTETIATTKALMVRVGKKPIIVKKDIPGLIGSRIQVAMAREIESLLAQDVASPEDIDTVAKASYGFRHACIGNLEAYDMVGLDTMEAVERRIYKELSNATDPTPILVEKVQRGELGVKSGQGWFDYTGKSKEKVLDSQNRRLLKQLALFKSFEKEG